MEPAASERASPFILLGKKDGSLLVFVDSRRVNMNTVTDSYPVLRMDDCIDPLGDAAVFTTLFCNSG